MIRFLIKGLLRDRSRLLFPILVVIIGVFLTVSLHAWIGGAMMDIIQSNADFSTGHVRVLTKAYAENEDQMPNDLAIEGVSDQLARLHQQFPDMTWVYRIRFAGLLDIPDANGETRAQGPFVGMAVDLLSANRSREKDRLNMSKAVVRGHLISQSGEILISDEFAGRLGIQPGDKVTFLGSTMNGSMAMQNYVIAGTLHFGLPPMDKGAMIMDVADAQAALDMADAASEIVGYFDSNLYDDQHAIAVAKIFNEPYLNSRNEFDPMMLTLGQQNGLADYINMARYFSSIIVAIFIAAMCIVLWNAGLLGGLRRYGEIGVRLAIGEYKGHIYRSMIVESIVIGLAGSIIGTAIGLVLVYYIQIHGLDFSSMFKNSGLMISTVIHTHVTAQTCYLGFIPGLFATVLGTMLAGIGIYRRNTAQLFKEFEG
jgi:putative ABC transport system permease protein